MLLVAVHALGLFMAITGGFIALIAALLGMIEWITDESQGYEVGDVLVWFGWVGPGPARRFPRSHPRPTGARRTTRLLVEPLTFT